MSQTNPATPAQAANPGSGEQVQPQSSAAPQAPSTQQGQGGQPEEKVSISLKEYRDLQRDHARVLSFDKRKDFVKKNPSGNPPGNGAAGNDDPELVEQVRVNQERAETAEKRAMQAEVKSGVRDILAKSEYANLPESTKNLILKNPAMLSEADNVEEALLDIEDFVRENTPAGSSNSNQSGQGAASRPNPTGHEAPPTVSPGAPAPVNAEGLEDISKLSGVARSRAVLRNSLKKARGVKS